MSAEARTFTAHSGLTFVGVVAVAYAAVTATGALSALGFAEKVAANAGVCLLALAAAFPIARRRVPISVAADGDLVALQLGSSRCSFPTADAKEVRVFCSAVAVQVEVAGPAGIICRVELLLGFGRKSGHELTAWLAERLAPIPVSRVAHRLS